MECRPHPKAWTGKFRGHLSWVAEVRGQNPKPTSFSQPRVNLHPGSGAQGGVVEKLRKEGWPSATSPAPVASGKVGFCAAFLNVQAEVGISPARIVLNVRDSHFSSPGLFLCSSFRFTCPPRTLLQAQLPQPGLCFVN